MTSSVPIVADVIIRIADAASMNKGGAVSSGIISERAGEVAAKLSGTGSTEPERIHDAAGVLWCLRREGA